MSFRANARDLTKFDVENTQDPSVQLRPRSPYRGAATYQLVLVASRNRLIRSCALFTSLYWRETISRTGEESSSFSIASLYSLTAESSRAHIQPGSHDRHCW